MHTTTSTSSCVRRRDVLTAGALVSVFVMTGVVGTADAAGSPAQPAPAGSLAVSYTAPPPSLVLTAYASIPIPAGAETEPNVPEVAVLPDGGAVVIDAATRRLPRRRQRSPLGCHPDRGDASRHRRHRRPDGLRVDPG